ASTAWRSPTATSRSTPPTSTARSSNSAGAIGRVSAPRRAASEPEDPADEREHDDRDDDDDRGPEHPALALDTHVGGDRPLALVPGVPARGPRAGLRLVLAALALHPARSHGGEPYRGPSIFRLIGNVAASRSVLCHCDRATRNGHRFAGATACRSSARLIRSPV